MNVRSKQAGLGLVETLTALAIAATLTGLSVPAMTQLKQRQQLHGLADTVMTDLQQARRMAVERGQSVRFAVIEHKSGSCYVIYTGPEDSCVCGESGATVCTASGQEIKSERIAAERHLSLQMNADRITFGARQGTATPTATLKLSSTNGEAIHQIVAITGRVRACAPGAKLGSIPKCVDRA